MELFRQDDDFAQLRAECTSILALYDRDPEVGHEAEDALKDAAIEWMGRGNSDASERARVSDIIGHLTRKTHKRKWYA